MKFSFCLSGTQENAKIENWKIEKGRKRLKKNVDPTLKGHTLTYRRKRAIEVGKHLNYNNIPFIGTSGIERIPWKKTC